MRLAARALKLRSRTAVAREETSSSRNVRRVPCARSYACMSKTQVLIIDHDAYLSRLSAMVLENSGASDALTRKTRGRAPVPCPKIMLPNP